jgi:membrane-associated protein
MSLLMTGAGLVAMSAILGLLFIEEVGVPLPMFPADGLLLAAGALVATGAVRWWIMLPLLVLTDVAGAAIGYAWVRALGRKALYRLAGRMHATTTLDRLSDRLSTAGAAGVFVTRLIPGTRVYTNLVAGVMDMKPRAFLAGMAPAAAVWVTVVTSLGIVVGNQAARYVASFEQIGLDVLLVATIVFVCYLALRGMPRRRVRGLHLVTDARTQALALGLIVDSAIVLAAAEALVLIALHLAGLQEPDGMPDQSLLIGAATIAYIAVTRFGFGATVGEKLLSVSYGPPLRSTC